MNKALLQILQLSGEMLIQARLMTAYSGQTDKFNFPQDQNWFVGQTRIDCAGMVHYTANIFNSGDWLLTVPDHSSKFGKLFDRISASKIHRYHFNYMLKMESKLKQLQENYTCLKQAHQLIAQSLHIVNQFLSYGNKDYIFNKLDTLKELKFCIDHFESNPLLHHSHCEYALHKINHLILAAPKAFELNRDAVLYCFAQNVLLEKIDTLVENYHPMGTGAFADPVVRKIIRCYPLFGCPRPMFKQHIDILNQNLKHQFELKQKEFTTLMTSLMLCYSDALVFPENLQKYITGDSTAISFEALMKKSELDLNKTNIVRGNLVEGELYQQLDLPTSFQPVFRHYKAH